MSLCLTVLQAEFTKVDTEEIKSSSYQLFRVLGSLSHSTEVPVLFPLSENFIILNGNWFINGSLPDP